MGKNQQLERVVQSFSLSALLLLSPLAAMPAHAESTIASEYESETQIEASSKQVGCKCMHMHAR